MDVETLPFSEKTAEAQEKHKKLLEQLEREKRARQIAVPTKDVQVKQKLRELGEPICLFGEEPPERRNRLREILAKMNLTDSSSSFVASAVTTTQPVSSKDQDEIELFYTEGTPELRQARQKILKFSIPRARLRVRRQKRKKEEEDADDVIISNGAETYIPSDDKNAWDLFGVLGHYGLHSSQLGAEDPPRPLSYCSISPNGGFVATSSWSGSCRLWEAKEGNVAREYRGHKERASAIVFHPQSTISLPPNVVNLASCSFDRTLKLWSLTSSTPLATLQGHQDRINRVAFHPSGDYVASSSFDMTWRLWDVNTQKELLVQEGHSRPVYALAFHPDGSLVVSAGLDCIGRVWDLRSGKSVHVLHGHVKEVLAADFSPNGHQLATGSEDHTIRIWDLRRKKSIYVIPAHSSIISSIKYERETSTSTGGRYLISGSFDKTVKLWSARDFRNLKTLSGHENHVMAVDCSPSSDYFVSASQDRTWKIWRHEEEFIA
eukprot:TRINITY_DN1178_c0_g1_i1.p1 TRINITY_DN1178_c0_g1~~TRINITY_DN1178_c0_g1_i1.p1  ORF type:complete len:502 (-),score=108.84 TRINITY_DN1178_c0_g1_i1:180-1652(-)